MGAELRADEVLLDCVGWPASKAVAALLAHGSEHGVVILPDGTLRALERVGSVEKPTPLDRFWEVIGDEINHPTAYVDNAEDPPPADADAEWTDPVYRLAGIGDNDDCPLVPPIEEREEWIGP